MGNLNFVAFNCHIKNWLFLEISPIQSEEKLGTLQFSVMWDVVKEDTAVLFFMMTVKSSNLKREALFGNQRL